jgi:hypothetical protein
MRQTIAAGLMTVLAGCSEAGGGARWGGTITDSAGIQIVHNPGTGMWEVDDQWTVTEALRIGAAEGEPEYQFGSLAGLSVASDGRIVVFDAQGRHLKVFGVDGKYERTIGGPGGGPGEIGPQGAQLVIAPGDTLVLSDVGNQRVSLYLIDGTFVRSFGQSFADGFAFRWETTDDGRIVTQLRRVAIPGTTTTSDSMDVIVVRHLDGTMGDTLLSVPSGKSFSFSGGAPEWNLFVPEPLWALWGDRLLYGMNNAYRFGVYAPGGKLERVIEKPFTVAPVTEVDQSAFKSLFEEGFRAAGLPANMMAQFLDRVHFAPTYPAFGQMLAGPDRTILVQFVKPISSMSEEDRAGLELTDLQAGAMGSADWDFFDSDGRYLGVVTMPVRYQPMRFLGDKIYGIQRDDLDVQYVVVLNVVKGKKADG